MNKNKTIKGIRIIKINEREVGKYYLTTVPDDDPETGHILYLKLQTTRRNSHIISVVGMDTILLMANANSMNTISDKAFKDSFFKITGINPDEVQITQAAAEWLRGYSDEKLPIW